MSRTTRYARRKVATGPTGSHFGTAVLKGTYAARMAAVQERGARSAVAALSAYERANGEIDSTSAARAACEAFLDNARTLARSGVAGLPADVVAQLDRMHSRRRAARARTARYAARTGTGAALPTQRPAAPLPVVIDAAELRAAILRGGRQAHEAGVQARKAARALTAAMTGQPANPKTFRFVTRHGGQMEATR